jgi:hypothetical protein
MSDTAGDRGSGVGGGRDEGLLTRLRLVVREHDPVPEAVFAAARAAWGWRTIDADLAALTFDSAMAERELAGVRGTAQPRLLTFSAGHLTVEVEVHEQRQGRRLVGQVVPPAAGRLEVRHPGGQVDAAVDDLGRFVADGVPAGPVSLRCHTAGGIVDTDWTGM